MRKKSNFIILSYRKKIALPPWKFEYELITRTEDVKLLGVYIDEHLNISQRVSTIVWKFRNQLVYCIS